MNQWKQTSIVKIHHLPSAIPLTGLPSTPFQLPFRGLHWTAGRRAAHPGRVPSRYWHWRRSNPSRHPSGCLAAEGLAPPPLHHHNLDDEKAHHHAKLFQYLINRFYLLKCLYWKKSSLITPKFFLWNLNLSESSNLPDITGPWLP